MGTEQHNKPQTDSVAYPLIQFSTEPTTYISPSWNDLQQLVFLLSQEILAQNLYFDRIVTLSKGGWPMSRALLDFLGIDQIASIGVKFYTGIDERQEKPQVYQEIPVEIRGERVLLFDDVADTGRSLQFAAEYLHLKGATAITMATLFYKPRSIVKPDFYGAETTDWIVFPYEMGETLEVLGKRWQAAGISQSEIVERFTKLGFRSEWTESLLKKHALLKT